MKLVLQVVQWPEGVEQRPQMAYFDADGGMIGRSETARLSLTDPHRMVSRFHAHVSCRGDRYYLEDMGSTNPASVNGVVLGANERAELNFGDAICIGGYTLAVTSSMALVSKDEAEKSLKLQPERVWASRRRALGESEQDAIHTRFGPIDEEDFEAPVLNRVVSDATTLPQTPAAVMKEISMPSQLGEATPSMFEKAEAFADRRRAEPETIPGFVQVDTLQDNERFDDEDSSSEAQLARLWHAFQEGAQLGSRARSDLRPDFMRSVGAMLRRFIGGMRRLAKPVDGSDSGVGVVLRGGNTLRLAVDDTRAMLAALRPPVANFLTGPAAVDELMNSLEARHAATEAALRQVVEQLLKKLEPQALEKTLDGSGRVGGLSLLRKARLWDLYAEQHRSLVDRLGEGLVQAFEQASKTEVECSREEPGPQRARRSS